jgi:hypothetical protein
MVMTEEFKKGFPGVSRLSYGTNTSFKGRILWIRSLSDRRIGRSFLKNTISFINTDITSKSSRPPVSMSSKSSGIYLSSFSNYPHVIFTLFFRAGTVESRLRQLVMKLELTESLTLAHPFIKGFDQVAYCVSDDEIRLVAQGDTTPAIAKRKAEDIEGIEGARPVYSTTFYVGLGIEAKQRAWISKDWDQAYCSSFLSY